MHVKNVASLLAAAACALWLLSGDRIAAAGEVPLFSSQTDSIFDFSTNSAPVDLPVASWMTSCVASLDAANPYCVSPAICCATLPTPDEFSDLVVFSDTATHLSWDEATLDGDSSDFPYDHVPEPGGYALMVLGLLMLGVFYGRCAIKFRACVRQAF